MDENAVWLAIFQMLLEAMLGLAVFLRRWISKMATVQTTAGGMHGWRLRLVEWIWSRLGIS